jgi:hypothetical protein
MISQVEHTPGVSDDCTHIPISAETALTFCSSCGNRMSRNRLQAAIDSLLKPEGNETSTKPLAGHEG